MTFVVLSLICVPDVSQVEADIAHTTLIHRIAKSMVRNRLGSLGAGKFVKMRVNCMTS